MDELGVGAGDRALRRAGPSRACARSFVNSSLRDERLGDDHAERQLAHQRGEPLALAVRLLVERAVVEREPDAPCDLRGQLRQVGIRPAWCVCQPNVSAPSVRPRTIIGTESSVRMPTVCTATRCSGLR